MNEKEYIPNILNDVFNERKASIVQTFQSIFEKLLSNKKNHKDYLSFQEAEKFISATMVKLFSSEQERFLSYLIYYISYLANISHLKDPNFASQFYIKKKEFDERYDSDGQLRLILQTFRSRPVKSKFPDPISFFALFLGFSFDATMIRSTLFELREIVNNSMKTVFEFLKISKTEVNRLLKNSSISNKKYEKLEEKSKLIQKEHEKELKSYQTTLHNYQIQIKEYKRNQKEMEQFKLCLESDLLQLISLIESLEKDDLGKSNPQFAINEIKKKSSNLLSKVNLTISPDKNKSNSIIESNNDSSLNSELIQRLKEKDLMIKDLKNQLQNTISLLDENNNNNNKSMPSIKPDIPISTNSVSKMSEIVKKSSIDLQNALIEKQELRKKLFHFKDLQSKYDSLEKERNELKQKLEETSLLKEKYHQKNKSLRQQIKENEVKFNSLTQHVSKLQKKVDQQRNRLLSAEKPLTESDFTNFKSSLLIEQIEEKTNSLVEYENSLNQLQIDNLRLLNENEMYRKTKKLDDKKISQLRENMKELTKQLDERDEQFRDLRNSLTNSNVSIIEEQLQTSLNENQNLIQKFNKYIKKYQDLKSYSQNLVDENNQLKQQIDLLKNDKSQDLKSYSQNLVDENNQLKQQIDLLKNDKSQDEIISQLTNKIEKLEKMSIPNDDLQLIAQRYVGLLSPNNTVAEIIDDLALNLEKSKKELKEKSDQLSLAESKTGQLQELITKLQAENQRISKYLSDFLSNIRSFLPCQNEQELLQLIKQIILENEQMKSILNNLKAITKSENDQNLMKIITSLISECNVLNEIKRITKSNNIQNIKSKIIALLKNNEILNNIKSKFKQSSNENIIEKISKLIQDNNSFIEFRSKLMQSTSLTLSESINALLHDSSELNEIKSKFLMNQDENLMQKIDNAFNELEELNKIRSKLALNQNEDLMQKIDSIFNELEELNKIRSKLGLNQSKDILQRIDDALINLDEFNKVKSKLIAKSKDIENQNVDHVIDGLIEDNDLLIEIKDKLKQHLNSNQNFSETIDILLENTKELQEIKQQQQNQEENASNNNHEIPIENQEIIDKMNEIKTLLKEESATTIINIIQNLVQESAELKSIKQKLNINDEDGFQTIDKILQENEEFNEIKHILNQSSNDNPNLIEIITTLLRENNELKEFKLQYAQSINDENISQAFDDISSIKQSNLDQFSDSKDVFLQSSNEFLKNSSEFEGKRSKLLDSQHISFSESTAILLEAEKELNQIKSDSIESTKELSQKVDSSISDNEELKEIKSKLSILSNKKGNENKNSIQIIDDLIEDNNELNYIKAKLRKYLNSNHNLTETIDILIKNTEEIKQQNQQQDEEILPKLSGLINDQQKLLQDTRESLSTKFSILIQDSQELKDVKTCLLQNSTESFSTRIESLLHDSNELKELKIKLLQGSNENLSKKVENLLNESNELNEIRLEILQDSNESLHEKIKSLLNDSNELNEAKSRLLQNPTDSFSNQITNLIKDSNELKNVKSKLIKNPNESLSQNIFQLLQKNQDFDEIKSRLLHDSNQSLSKRIDDLLGQSIELKYAKLKAFQDSKSNENLASKIDLLIQESNELTEIKLKLLHDSSDNLSQIIDHLLKNNSEFDKIAEKLIENSNTNDLHQIIDNFIQNKKELNEIKSKLIQFLGPNHTTIQKIDFLLQNDQEFKSMKSKIIQNSNESLQQRIDHLLNDFSNYNKIIGILRQNSNFQDPYQIIDNLIQNSNELNEIKSKLLRFSNPNESLLQKINNLLQINQEHNEMKSQLIQDTGEILSQKIDNLLKENYDFNKLLSKLNQNSNLQDPFQIIDQLVHSNIELNEAKSKLVHFANPNENFLQKIDHLLIINNELNEIRSKLINFSNSKESLVQKINRLLQFYHELEQTKSKLIQNSNENLSQRTDQLLEDSLKYSKLLTQLKQDSSSNDASQIIDSFIQNKNELNEVKSKLNCSLDSKESLIQKIETLIQNNDELAEIKPKLDHFSDSKENLYQKVDKLLRNNSELNETKSMLIKFSNKKATFSQKITKLLHIFSQYSEIRSKLKNFSDSDESTLHKIDSLLQINDELNKVKSKLDESSDSTGDLLQKLDNLIHNNEELNETKSMLVKFSDKKMSLSQKIAKLLQCKSQLTEIESKLSNFSGSNKSISQKIDDLLQISDELNETKEKLNQFSISNENINQKIDELIQNNDELTKAKERLNHFSNSDESLITKVNILLQNNHELKEMKSRLNQNSESTFCEQISSLNQKVDELEEVKSKLNDYSSEDLAQGIDKLLLENKKLKEIQSKLLSTSQPDTKISQRVNDLIENEQIINQLRESIDFDSPDEIIQNFERLKEIAELFKCKNHKQLPKVCSKTIEKLNKISSIMDSDVNDLPDTILMLKEKADKMNQTLAKLNDLLPFNNNEELIEKIKENIFVISGIHEIIPFNNYKQLISSLKNLICFDNEIEQIFQAENKKDAIQKAKEQTKEFIKICKNLQSLYPSEDFRNIIPAIKEELNNYQEFINKIHQIIPFENDEDLLQSLIRLFEANDLFKKKEIHQKKIINSFKESFQNSDLNIQNLSQQINDIEKNHLVFLNELASKMKINKNKVSENKILQKTYILQELADIIHNTLPEEKNPINALHIILDKLQKDQLIFDEIHKIIKFDKNSNLPILIKEKEHHIQILKEVADQLSLNSIEDIPKAIMKLIRKINGSPKSSKLPSNQYLKSTLIDILNLQQNNDDDSIIKKVYKLSRCENVINSIRQILNIKNIKDIQSAVKQLKESKSYENTPQFSNSNSAQFKNQNSSIIQNNSQNAPRLKNPNTVQFQNLNSSLIQNKSPNVSQPQDSSTSQFQNLNSSQLENQNSSLLQNKSQNTSQLQDSNTSQFQNLNSSQFKNQNSSHVQNKSQDASQLQDSNTIQLQSLISSQLENQNSSLSLNKSQSASQIQNPNIEQFQNLISSQFENQNSSFVQNKSQNVSQLQDSNIEQLQNLISSHFENQNSSFVQNKSQNVSQLQDSNIEQLQNLISSHFENQNSSLLQNKSLSASQIQDPNIEQFQNSNSSYPQKQNVSQFQTSIHSQDLNNSHTQNQKNSQLQNPNIPQPLHHNQNVSHIQNSDSPQFQNSNSSYPQNQNASQFQNSDVSQFLNPDSTQLQNLFSQLTNIFENSMQQNDLTETIHQMKNENAQLSVLINELQKSVRFDKNNEIASYIKELIQKHPNESPQLENLLQQLSSLKKLDTILIEIQKLKDNFAHETEELKNKHQKFVNSITKVIDASNIQDETEIPPTIMKIKNERNELQKKNETNVELIENLKQLINFNGDKDLVCKIEKLMKLKKRVQKVKDNIDGIKDIEDLPQFISDIQNELQNATKKYSSIVRQLTSLTGEKSETRSISEIRNQIDELKLLEDEIKRISSANNLKEALSKIREAINDKKALEDLSNSLSMEIDYIPSEIVKLQNQINSLKSQNSNLQENLDSKNSEISKFKEKHFNFVSSLSSTLQISGKENEIIKTITELKSRNESLKKSNSSIQSKILKLLKIDNISEFPEKISDLVQEKNELQKELSNMNERIRSLQEEFSCDDISQIQEIFESLKKSKENSKDSHSKFVCQIASALQNQPSSPSKFSFTSESKLVDSVIKLRKNNSELSDKIKQTEKALSSLKENIQFNDFNDLPSAIQEIMNENEILLNSSKILNCEPKELIQSIEKIKNSLKNQKRLNDQIAKTFGISLNSVFDDNNLLLTLENQSTDLIKQLEVLDNAMKMLEVYNINDFSSKISEISEVRQTNEQKLQESEKKRAKLQDYFVTLKKSFSEVSNNEINNIPQEISTLKFENEKMKKTILEMDSSFKQFKDQITDGLKMWDAQSAEEIVNAINSIKSVTELSKSSHDNLIDKLRFIIKFNNEDQIPSIVENIVNENRSMAAKLKRFSQVQSSLDETAIEDIPKILPQLKSSLKNKSEQLEEMIDKHQNLIEGIRQLIPFENENEIISKLNKLYISAKDQKEKCNKITESLKNALDLQDESDIMKAVSVMKKKLNKKEEIEKSFDNFIKEIQRTSNSQSASDIPSNIIKMRKQIEKYEKIISAIKQLLSTDDEENIISSIQKLLTNNQMSNEQIQNNDEIFKEIKKTINFNSPEKIPSIIEQMNQDLEKSTKLSNSLSKMLKSNSPDDALQKIEQLKNDSKNIAFEFNSFVNQLSCILDSNQTTESVIQKVRSLQNELSDLNDNFKEVSQNHDNFVELIGRIIKNTDEETIPEKVQQIVEKLKSYEIANQSQLKTINSLKQILSVNSDETLVKTVQKMLDSTQKIKSTMSMFNSNYQLSRDDSISELNTHIMSFESDFDSLRTKFDQIKTLFQVTDDDRLYDILSTQRENHKQLVSQLLNITRVDKEKEIVGFVQQLIMNHNSLINELSEITGFEDPKQICAAVKQNKKKISNAEKILGKSNSKLNFDSNDFENKLQNLKNTVDELKNITGNENEDDLVSSINSIYSTLRSKRRRSSFFDDNEFDPRNAIEEAENRNRILNELKSVAKSDDIEQMKDEMIQSRKIINELKNILGIENDMQIIPQIKEIFNLIPNPKKSYKKSAIQQLKDTIDDNKKFFDTFSKEMNTTDKDEGLSNLKKRLKFIDNLKKVTGINNEDEILHHISDIVQFSHSENEQYDFSDDTYNSDNDSDGINSRNHPKKRKLSTLKLASQKINSFQKLSDKIKKNSGFEDDESATNKLLHLSEHVNNLKKITGIDDDDDLFSQIVELIETNNNNEGFDSFSNKLKQRRPSLIQMKSSIEQNKKLMNMIQSETKINDSDKATQKLIQSQKIVNELKRVTGIENDIQIVPQIKAILNSIGSTQEGNPISPRNKIEKMKKKVESNNKISEMVKDLTQTNSNEDAADQLNQWQEIISDLRQLTHSEDDSQIIPQIHQVFSLFSNEHSPGNSDDSDTEFESFGQSKALQIKASIEKNKELINKIKSVEQINKKNNNNNKDEDSLLLTSITANKKLADELRKITDINDDDEKVIRQIRSIFDAAYSDESLDSPRFGKKSKKQLQQKSVTQTLADNQKLLNDIKKISKVDDHKQLKLMAELFSSLKEITQIDDISELKEKIIKNSQIIEQLLQITGENDESSMIEQIQRIFNVIENNHSEEEENFNLNLNLESLSSSEKLQLTIENNRSFSNEMMKLFKISNMTQLKETIEQYFMIISVLKKNLQLSNEKQINPAINNMIQILTKLREISNVDSDKNIKSVLSRYINLFNSMSSILNITSGNDSDFLNALEKLLSTEKRYKNIIEVLSNHLSYHNEDDIPKLLNEKLDQSRIDRNFVSHLFSLIKESNQVNITLDESLSTNLVEWFIKYLKEADEVLGDHKKFIDSAAVYGYKGNSAIEASKILIEHSIERRKDEIMKSAHDEIESLRIDNETKISIIENENKKLSKALQNALKARKENQQPCSDIQRKSIENELSLLNEISELTNTISNYKKSQEELVRLAAGKSYDKDILIKYLPKDDQILLEIM